MHRAKLFLVKFCLTNWSRILLPFMHPAGI